MEKEQKQKMLDDLEYALSDGMSLDGWKRNFHAREYAWIRGLFHSIEDDPKWWDFVRAVAKEYDRRVKKVEEEENEAH